MIVVNRVLERLPKLWSNNKKFFFHFLGSPFAINDETEGIRAQRAPENDILIVNHFVSLMIKRRLKGNRSISSLMPFSFAELGLKRDHVTACVSDKQVPNPVCDIFSSHSPAANSTQF